jgi:hypothetical protein
MRGQSGRAAASGQAAEHAAGGLKLGLSFCVLVDISPRRAKLGGVPRGMRDALNRRPSAGYLPLAQQRRARGGSWFRSLVS